jgi:cell division septation protein DedD
MAPVYSDREDGDQAQLGFGPGGRSPASGAGSIDEEAEAAAAAPARRAAGGEPARSEFFRERRRPVLPFVGLIGAVATVAAFLWLGRDGAPPAFAPEGEALAPVAAASPNGALADPLAPAAGSTPAATRVAAAPPVEAPGEAFPDAGFGDPAPAPPAAVAALTAPSAPPVEASAAALAAKSAASSPPAAPHSPRSLAGTDSFSVQLLAARSETDVNGAWKRLQGAHPDLLASLTPTVARADVAGGTFFRLRAGPLPARPEAEALCQALSSRQQPCFVVSPGS